MLTKSQSAVDGAPSWPAGIGRRILDQTESTNAYAGGIAAKLDAPAWILARRQTAGRARQGRAWVDPTGNFAASLVMRPQEAAQIVALRSFVAALALIDAVESATGPSSDLTLKWPNDVLMCGGKLAGILLESVGAGTGVASLVIGFGVNLVNSPELEAPTPHPPTSLALHTGVHLKAEDFLDHLAPAYARREAQFVQGGFDPIRRDWLARAANIGGQMTARTAKSDITGIFDTVDQNGRLVLSTPTGRSMIAAADVFF